MTDIIDPTKDKKKRPRPANLDLKSSTLAPQTLKAEPDMNELALKCVSPGLPPLSAQMKSAVLKSKSIEIQQRQLIASRNASATINRHPDSLVSDHEDENGDEGDDDEEIGDANGDGEENTNTTENDGTREISSVTPLPSSDVSNDQDDLAIPSAGSNKKFKRDKAPPPLNLAGAHSAPKPIIKSAPIYNINHSYFTPAISRRSNLKQQRRILSTTNSNFPPSATSASTVNSGRSRLNFTPSTPFDPNLYQRRPIPVSAAYPYGQPVHFHPGVVPPKTATTARTPVYLPQRTGPRLTQQQLERYQQQWAYQQQQWAKFKAYRDSKGANHVTDVFKGDTTRYAPVSAQPLSAQRAFFDLDEIKPQTVTNNKGYNKRGKFTEQEEYDDYNNDNNEDNDHQNKNKNDNDNDDANSGEGEGNEEEDDDDDGDDPESIAIEPDAEVGTSIPKSLVVKSEIKLDNNTFRFNFERNVNSTDNDKQRFLNHCATAWDQFNKLP